MAKSELTKQLEQAIYLSTVQMGVYGCFEVSIGWSCDERVDYMTYNTKGEFRCYEIKVSKADFRSKSKHSFVGHFGYYAMPTELYKQVQDEIPKGIGVYVHDGRFFSCVKKPKRTGPTIEPLLLSGFMIRALSRECEKQLKSNMPSVIERKDREIRRLFEERNRYRNDYNEERMKNNFGRTMRA
jgi:hypothetical protein